ncbi:MAG: hypothetical protein K9M02_16950 [Thiohalocapsa sp.]|nr:hypothetical protein [Thiohalocapsa sp.]
MDDNLGASLAAGALECPPLYTTDVISVPLERFPVVAHSAECGAEGPGDADDPASFTSHEPFDIRAILPVDPEENPCSEPSTTWEDGDSPCAHGSAGLAGIIAEIEDLCEERTAIRADMLDHQTQMTAYNAATAVLALAFFVVAIISANAPWPFNLILAIVAVALLLAALVTGSLAAYHTQEAERAERALDAIDERIAEAQERYRDALERAVQACCGRLPPGVAIEPPECP